MHERSTQPDIDDISAYEREPLADECGIVILFSPRKRHLLPILIKAGGGVQHRGQQGVGIAFEHDDLDQLHTFIKPGLIKNNFSNGRPHLSEDDNYFDYSVESRIAMLQTRYGTSGGYGEGNLQPCRAQTDKGQPVYVSMNGQVKMQRMRAKLLGPLPEEASDTLIFTHLLAEQSGRNWDEKILGALEDISGAYAFNIVVKQADQWVLYLARDKNGIRPLIIGELDGLFMAASETHAFDKVGMRVLREIRPGEVCRVDNTGLHVLKEGDDEGLRSCSFEKAYTGRPESREPVAGKPVEEWLTIHQQRFDVGKAAANTYPIEADIVMALPDSGIPFATGYAFQSRIPYIQMILRDHWDENGDKRLFMTDDDLRAIAEKVLGKLSLVQDRRLWKDKRVVIGDDSIVRGNESRVLTKALFEMGVSEVHWLIGFPPILYTCHLGVSMRGNHELIAANVYLSDEEKRLVLEKQILILNQNVAKMIGATSVNYVLPYDFLQAGMDTKVIVPDDSRDIFAANHSCGGCVTGRYPVMPEDIKHKRFDN